MSTIHAACFPASLPPDSQGNAARNFEGLASPFWLHLVLNYIGNPSKGPCPPTFGGIKCIVIEASWAKLDEAHAYRTGHVPGALHLNTDDLENGYPRWQLRNRAALQEVIGNYGIGADSTVVVYSAQLAAAARVWWLLKYAGVNDVRLLDGGHEAWCAQGYVSETAVNTAAPRQFAIGRDVTAGSNARSEECTQWLATTDYVEARLRSATATIADVRTRAEYLGEISGYDYLDAKGKLPTATHLGDARNTDSNDAAIYLRGDGRLRAVEDIRTLWQSRGLPVPSNSTEFAQEVIFYCGSGWRSSVAFFYAWLMGFTNIRNYCDGWCGWSTVYTPDADAQGSTPGWRQTPRAHNAHDVPRQ